MRKNGFTLIELLAVIVILAIIALIATPIILGIINDAREKANERSVELYASAVRNGIAAYQLREGKAPSKFSDLTIEYDGNVECKVEELYEDGSFYLAECSVNGKLVEGYTYGTKLERDLCTLINGDPYAIGSEYKCEVSSGEYKTFYVLSLEDDSFNLIMNENIGTSAWATNNLGDPNDESYCQYGGDCNSRISGPTDAINYLNSVTSSWNNINNLAFSYSDALGEYNSFALTGKTRLPMFSELENAGCNEIKGCPSWLNGSYSVMDTAPSKEIVSNLGPYYDRDVVTILNGKYAVITISDSNGIRPVINVKYSQQIPKNKIGGICYSSIKNTVGNLATGEYNLGDEYLCEVEPGVQKTFFILSKDGNKISLIMNDNIASNIEWGIDNSFNASDGACEYGQLCGNIASGPFVAMNKLHSLTKDWNVQNININYDDAIYGNLKTEGNSTVLTNSTGTTVVSYENLKSRLPKYEEVKDLGAASWLTVNTIGTADYAISGIGYWTLTSEPNSSHSSYCVGTNGVGVCYAYTGGGDTYTEYQGIRPVIEITIE